MKSKLVPIAIAVACAHGLALWALQSAWVQSLPKATAPVIMVANVIAPAQPEAVPKPLQAAPAARPKHEPPPQQPAPPKTKATPLPAPSAVAEPASNAPAATAPASHSEPPTAPPATATSASALATTPTPPLAPAHPAKLELPSSSARYLNNAPPPYPTLSKRMGEQGRVVVRAFIDVNGTASEASIATSSGYERLDQTALKTVLQWRYVPGKRAGVSEAMWFNIPLDFVLE